MKKKEDKILIKEIESLLLKSKENNTTASVIVKLLNRKLNSIAEEQEKFKILSNNLPGIAYLCKNDKNYSIIFVNKAVKKLTGYSASDFIKGKIHLANIFHPEDKDNIFEKVDKALQAKKQFKLEYRIITKEGSIKWVRESGNGVYKDQKLQH